MGKEAKLAAIGVERVFRFFYYFYEWLRNFLYTLSYEKIAFTNVVYKISDLVYKKLDKELYSRSYVIEYIKNALLDLRKV